MRPHILDRAREAAARRRIRRLVLPAVELLVWWAGIEAVAIDALGKAIIWLSKP